MKEHITSQPEDPDLVRPYTDLEEHPLSRVITSKETLGKEWEKNPEEVWDWVSKLISTYDYYAMDCNRLEERLREQNESNTGLELELEATRAQSKDASNYLKKESCRVERLETVIDQLIVAKTKTDTVLPSVEIPIDTSRHFVHALSPSANKSQSASSMQQDLSKTPYNDWGESVSTATRFSSKKSFPDSLIFTNGKDPTIEQWLSKMRSKLKLNQEHYPDNDTQICYAENRCGGEALEHLQPHLRADSLIPFETVDDLFTKLEEVYGDPHRKEHAMEKFRELKMGSGSFNAFYSEFIKLAAELEFTKEMLLREFMHKLSPCMQDRMNSGLEYPDNIKDLAARCRKIYDQILATDWVRSNIKLVNIKVANTTTRFIPPTRFVPPSSQTTSTSISGYRPKPGNTFSPLTNEERLKLMKEGRCFYCRQPGHTTANCPKSITKATSVAEIAGTAIDNSEISGKE